MYMFNHIHTHTYNHLLIFIYVHVQSYTHLFVHKFSMASSTCTPLRCFSHLHRAIRSAPRSPDTPPACDAGAGKVWHKVMISGHWSWEAVSGGAVSVGHAYNCQAQRGRGLMVGGTWWEFW